MPKDDDNPLEKAVQRHEARRRRWMRDGEPSFGRSLAQVGVLGWMIVTPGLLGLLAGRWLDQHFGTGLFWTGPLLVLGIALGCWSAWRWMHE